MSSGTDMSREEREEQRREQAGEQHAQLRRQLALLKPAGNDWVRYVSERKEPPSQQEWALWRELNRVLAML